MPVYIPPLKSSLLASPAYSVCWTVLCLSWHPEAPPTAKLSGNAETSCIIMYVCVLAEAKSGVWQKWWWCVCGGGGWIHT